MVNVLNILMVFARNVHKDTSFIAKSASPILKDACNIVVKIVRSASWVMSLRMENALDIKRIKLVYLDKMIGIIFQLHLSMSDSLNIISIIFLQDRNSVNSSSVHTWMPITKIALYQQIMEFQVKDGKPVYQILHNSLV